MDLKHSRKGAAGKLVGCEPRDMGRHTCLWLAPTLTLVLVQMAALGAIQGCGARVANVGSSVDGSKTHGIDLSSVGESNARHRQLDDGNDMARDTGRPREFGDVTDALKEVLDQNPKVYRGVSPEDAHGDAIMVPSKRSDDPAPPSAETGQPLRPNRHGEGGTDGRRLQPVWPGR